MSSVPAYRRRSQKPVSHELGDHRRARSDVELGEHPPDVRRDGPGADVEHHSDSPVGVSVGDQPCDLELAWAESHVREVTGAVVVTHELVARSLDDHLEYDLAARHGGFARSSGS
jgi:hypothetical protein